ncbi:hypothetical protein BDY17DRAFT_202348 [Neohortaea acidophila]|uniref:Uncharacterized protein n=1 Tax=Neohortaea acidophila TaxID=245834 RepID=A0A6A6PLJ6_9PEZI|nr:uncharacterized protein BDY17DRAFT_202348 [Neohortaea acidophila]KAF2480909.1 hypothetical protein BDY17DRAFT_202348 [Neohortaea acidophila]
MNQSSLGGARKTSGDSGQSAGGADRWTQRRLQRLNTEQGFREQRQGGQGVHSAPTTTAGEALGSPTTYSSSSHAQPRSAQAPAYHSDRSAPTNANATSASQPVTLTSATRSPNASHSPYTLSSQQYSPSDSTFSNTTSDTTRPALAAAAAARSYTHSQPLQQGPGEDLPMAAPSNNGSLAPKIARPVAVNRQSVQNGASLAPGQQQSGGLPQAYQTNQPPADTTRAKTPQPVQTVDDMTDEDVNQLIKDHKELREKYTKVKKYYFEKEDQVKQLQNSLAHQRLSQSRTSLDDSEYTTRFNRLDGLIAQLAFAIRKSWRTVPAWLRASVNKDAMHIGKQEMTAAGRAFISCWLVQEVFEKYFHPDLDPTFSAHLKSIQRHIRLFAPPSQTAEEEEYLTSKVVNWRLATLEGLQEVLRSPQCAANRAQLTESLKQHLVGALSMHLQDPTPPDLEGGVHMIIELVVSIASHLPLESRDVVIDYFTPGYAILQDQMKLETGIPPLTASIAEDDTGAEDENVDDDDDEHDENTRKKGGAGGMLGALTSSGSKAKGSGGTGDQRKGNGASALGAQDGVSRVRMAAGIGVQIRGRSVLVKAAVFATP